MSGKPKYTEQLIKDFKALVASGMTQTDAAKQLVTSIETVKAVAKRLGLPVPKRTSAVELVQQFEKQVLAGEISQNEIAGATGLSQCSVSKVYKRFGYPTLKACGMVECRKKKRFGRRRFLSTT